MRAAGTLSQIVGLCVIGFSVGFWAAVGVFLVILGHHCELRALIRWTK